MIRMHITPYLGGQRLDRLQPEHLEQLYNALIEKGLSPTSVLRVHRMHLPRAEGRHAAPAHPPQRRHARRPARTAPQRGRDRPHLEEATAVLHEARGLRDEARWTVALALGLRQSEALALQWKDIDLLNGTLAVRRTLHRVQGMGLVYEPPKDPAQLRTLALPIPLVRALHEHKAARPASA
jgi:integrase